MRPDNTKWVVLIVVAAVIGAVAGPMIGQSLSGGTAMLLFGLIMLGVIGLVVWSLSGNKVGKPASAAETADARAMKPAPGTARIYVVRRGFMGGLAGMKIGIARDGASVASGQVRMNQFVMAEVPPGTYRVETEMARNGAKSSRSDSEVSVHAGEVAVILAQLQMEALHAMTVQNRVHGGEAQGEIARTKLVRWNERAGGAAPA